jgi:hypothetical protein
MGKRFVKNRQPKLDAGKHPKSMNVQPTVDLLSLILLQ